MKESLSCNYLDYTQSSTHIETVLDERQQFKP